MGKYSEDYQQQQSEWCELVLRTAIDLSEHIGKDDADDYAVELRQRVGLLLSYFRLEDN
jgi:hypothetical protein